MLKEKEVKERKEKEEKEKKEQESRDKIPMKYFIEVKTADELSSGTDANVFISIYGEETDELHVQLKDSRTNKNLFEKGNCDVFEPTLKNVGKVCCKYLIFLFFFFRWLIF